MLMLLVTFITKNVVRVWIFLFQYFQAQFILLKAHEWKQLKFRWPSWFYCFSSNVAVHRTVVNRVKCICDIFFFSANLENIMVKAYKFVIQVGNG